MQKGEILGFFGLVGAKRTEVMRAIFGADKLISGSIEMFGKQVSNVSPFQSIKNGIGLLPENRKEQGFVRDLTNADNISLASLKKYQDGIFVSKRRNARILLRKARLWN